MSGLDLSIYQQVKFKTMEHRYILEPYHGMSSRFICPSCNDRQKSFSRYINIETGQYLAEDCGRCNREGKCGYHFTPKQYFETNGTPNDNFKSITRNPVESAKKASFMPIEVIKDSFSVNSGNDFYIALKRLYGAYTANQVFSHYKIGSSSRWEGATVFWQIDTQNRVRTGKIMLYNPEMCKRVKDGNGKSLIDWAHRFTENGQFNLNQCFFGEHLLAANDNRPVGIVESEKTAVIASIHLPAITWLACGAKTGLNDKCEVLKGRKVILYPDLGCYDDWAEKAKKYGFAIADILEKAATPEQRASGMDLADFLIKDLLYPDGRIDVNQSYIIENKIINRWSEAEQAYLAGDHKQVEAIIRELTTYCRQMLTDWLGLHYAPQAYHHYKSQTGSKN